MCESDLNFIFAYQKNFLGLSKFARSWCAHTFPNNKHYVKYIQSYTLFFLASLLPYQFLFPALFGGACLCLWFFIWLSLL